ncbi:hypothetical protein AB0C47_13520 [Micromonospora taraxaci]|uniref:hypothetical protein n=1 Tax=Micromonospora taraxaci TaxID=1316803 RepID=UPI0033CAB4CF
MTDDTRPTDPAIGADVTGDQQWRMAARRTLTRLLADQLNRVQVSAGQQVADFTGAADIAHLTRLVGPSGRVDVVENPGQAHLLVGAGGFDVVLADRLPDQADALAPMANLLRSGGWLILAGTVVAPPVVHTSVAGGTSTTVIERVIRAIHTFLRSPVAPPSADHTIGLLIALGMDHVCTATQTETSRGGGPGCTLYRHIAQPLRDQLIDAGFTTAELSQFDRILTDPGIVLSIRGTVALHAQKSTA